MIVNSKSPRYLRKKYVLVYGHHIAVEDSTPYENLLFVICGENGFSIPYEVMGYRTEILEETLSQLKEREAEMLRHRYGIWDEKGKQVGKTYSEIAKIFDKNIQQVREFENKILRKLKNPKRYNILLGENINKYKKILSIDCDIKMKVYIYPATKQIEDFIDRNSCKSPLDFIIKAEKSTNKDITKLAECLLVNGIT